MYLTACERLVQLRTPARPRSRTLCFCQTTPAFTNKIAAPIAYIQATLQQCSTQQDAKINEGRCIYTYTNKRNSGHKTASSQLGRSSLGRRAVVQPPLPLPPAHTTAAADVGNRSSEVGALDGRRPRRARELGGRRVSPELEEQGVLFPLFGPQLQQHRGGGGGDGAWGEGFYRWVNARCRFFCLEPEVPVRRVRRRGGG